MQIAVWWFMRGFRFGFLSLGLLVVALLPAVGLEKGGMPDLGQEEQTCLPTSTANLIIWFGQHGYPKLLASGATEEEREAHTLHIIMRDTNSRYDLGTRTDAITYGIEKYIHDAGYSGDVEYRGLDWSQARGPEIVEDDLGDKYRQQMKTPGAFTKDWLQENDDPNKGFILLLAYCRFDHATSTFTEAIRAGHAVTLVNAEPDLLLIHDPAHYRFQPGRKIVTPETLTGGTFQLGSFSAPVSGLLLLTGSLLEAPPHAGVMLTGAVCITMHPDKGSSTIIASSSGSPTATMGGTDSPASAATTAAPATPSTSTSWGVWLFDLLFGK
jgi:hypothetical protein